MMIMASLIAPLHFSSQDDNKFFDHMMSLDPVPVSCDSDVCMYAKQMYIYECMYLCINVCR